MQELILQPEDSIVLAPGERIEAGEEPLRIRWMPMSLVPNMSVNSETMLWETLKRQSGNQTAIYRRGAETRLVRVVPENPRLESFDNDGHTRTITNRAFKIQKNDMLGWLPKSGDTLEWNEKNYPVHMFGANVFYQDVGNYNVMLQIFVTEYRGNGQN